MAQKFGNSRWVQEGFLDNREDGTVVGRITFAVLGPVEFYLAGNCRGEIAGRVIRFKNSRFADEDLAAQVLGDVEIPQVGDASLISFDPHPHLVPHPYIEWFSMKKNHYRIELAPEDAWIASDAEIAEIDSVSSEIRERLRALYGRKPALAEESEWV
ncbi:MAG TPA: hypothetical protein PKV55_02960 [Nitrospira sp.]|nr:hypothetical protein [Nitrospira sp.]MBS0173361.1 hypothetical protein [Nitrospira sp.]MBX3336506.1 hypothetical protein [Nitrospira sp.]MCW5779039.1 hypothetical protein [Nitrospira sp.]HMZ54275.1 hypothetical protein [Nitrospira sp.]